MQLQVIYTFEDREQEVAICPFVPVILNKEETFFEFVTSILEGEEKEQLVKISCCIYYAVGLNLDADHWYNKENGKFYRDRIVELMSSVWGIRSLTAEIN